jgi:arylsulfatase A-like enzyme
MQMKAALSLLILTLAVSSFAATGKQSQPNVLFFALDDLCDWVGPLGYDQAVTPHMDKLADMGITFWNAHTGGIYCAPSRAAIFTGQYAPSTGCYTNQVYWRDRPELKPMHVAFQEGGYMTYGTGKLFHHPAGQIDMRGWDKFHVRSREQRETGWPLNSWDTSDPILPQPYPNSKYNSGRAPVNRFFLEWGKVLNEHEELMADTIRTEWACDLLRKKHDQPIFVGVGLYAPHFPNYCPEKYFDLYDRDKIEPPPYKEDDLDDLPPAVRKAKIARGKRHHEELVALDAVEDAIHGYLACVSYADAMLGRLLKAIEEGPNADNTIVVLWSDHGYHHGEKRDWGKHTLWQRTSRVPFIWAGPGVSKGDRIDTTVSLLDMYPTFVDMCGLPPVKGLEGKSLAKALRSPSQATDRNVLLPGMKPDEYAIMNQEWRYIHYADDTEELYNVREDVNEWHNLAGNKKYDSIKAKLRAAAPKQFVELRDTKIWKLVVEGETYRWEKK